MTRFKNAIVRLPSRSMLSGISTAGLGLPDYHLALEQHSNYVKALESCGLTVTVLDADEAFPDSTFVEDVALLTKECAIVCNPGAPSRNGEASGMREILQPFYGNIEEIKSPGTLEAGDVMMVGSHFYIGLSQRTNTDGASQLLAILEEYGMSGSVVELEKVLHLKTGLAYLENNNLLACGEFLNKAVFSHFSILEIDADEAYAANCIWVNDKVLVPMGFPKTTKIISQAGYVVHELDVSEFQKLDGGLSCLSLRF